MIFTSVLTWIILLPVIGSLAVMATPRSIARWLALLFSAATFVLSLAIFFRIAANGYNFGNLNNPAVYIHTPWINFTAGTITVKIDYFLGVDGLGLPMVILNALLTTLAIIGGWEKVRVKEYMALLLILEAGVMGVFMAFDLLLFFLFWEVELGPMFLLIGIWGIETIKHGMPGRIYSAWKFLLYTFFGSVFMLIGILVLYFTNVNNGGQATASMPYFSQHMFNGPVNIPFTGLTISLQLLTFLLIFLAFAIKIPMFPFHTWLPDAHTDAPTEVSVILAGILLKMGAYGLIRVCLTLLPQGLHAFAGWLAVMNAVFLRRCHLRPCSYTRNRCFRRRCEENANAGDALHLRGIGFAWPARSGWFRRGIYHLHQQLPGLDNHHSYQRFHDDPDSFLSAVDAQARLLRPVQSKVELAARCQPA
ncbi:MAG: NADH-quinone oxidoreductase subunit M [Chloroflexi bacterium]|nr:MAG: NADH-quinone oxidoreductase subunit M [Chloroflexota bacterium]